MLYVHTAELLLGELFWRVAALDAGNAVGTFTTGSFSKGWTAAPSVLTPSDGKVLSFPVDPVLFSWNALPGAVSYVLEIDDATDFIGADSYTTKNTAYVVTEPVTVGQTFYWRVRGVSGSLSSEWSVVSKNPNQPFSFTVDWPYIPVLVYPKADAKDITDVYFDWDPVLGAKTYQLQVSPNGDWANNKTTDITVKSTRYDPPEPLNNGNYYWRVRALDAASSPNYGRWSDDERLFQRGWSDTPEIVWPEEVSDAPSTSLADPRDPTWQNPTFRWSPAKHASWYRIRFAEDLGMTTQLQGCITNRTTWSPYAYVDGVGTTNPGARACSITLAKGETYYWDVMALDNPVENPGVDIWGPPKQSGSASSVYGLRSAVKSFRYDPPSLPAAPIRLLSSSPPRIISPPPIATPAMGVTRRPTRRPSHGPASRGNGLQGDRVAGSELHERLSRIHDAVQPADAARLLARQPGWSCLLLERHSARPAT